VGQAGLLDHQVQSAVALQQGVQLLAGTGQIAAIAGHIVAVEVDLLQRPLQLGEHVGHRRHAAGHLGLVQLAGRVRRLVEVPGIGLGSVEFGHVELDVQIRAVSSLARLSHR